MNRIVTSMILCGALALSLPALAQPGDGQKRAQVRQRITEFAIQQITQQLALDAATAQRFRAVADKYEPQIVGLHREVGMAMKELKAQLAAAQPDEARLSQLADTIVNDRTKVQALEAQRTADNRRVLTPTQFAKLVVVWPQINRQIKLEMYKAMHGGQAPASAEDME
ncbi:MAG: periplasmic heavy metal sensor [Polyangia bacterium]